MKKSYLLIAAAGLIMAACSQEDDFVAQNTAAQQNDGAVMFDTYLSNNGTRAGQEGIMTTSTLQKTGFGIVAFQHKLAENITTPNFMWNQYVGYEASNWVYSPLKYWPNETTTDKAISTATEMKATADNEGVSFYAYAPYVDETADTESATGKAWNGFQKLESGSKVGLIGMTTNAMSGDPKIHYQVATGAAANKYPSNSVDLLWGVSSGFAYHPVNMKDRDGADLGTGVKTVIMPEGLPVEKMQKPALDEKIKFDFKHALARIGLTVIGAFDQQAAGGTLDDRTRVTISEITVSGDAFATEGVLNLDNTDANRALWENLVTTANIDTDGDSSEDAVGVKVTDDDDDEMNPELRADQTNYATKFPNVAGVKATEQYVLTENTYTKVSKPVFDEKKTYFADENGTLIDLQETTPPVEWTKESDYSWFTVNKGVYTQATAPTWDLYESMSKTTAKETAVATTTEKTSMTGSYFKRTGTSGSYVYTPKAVADMEFDGSDKLTETDIYTLDVKTPVAKYTGDVYELSTKPRYFMIIPTTGNTPKDKVVTVAIKYYVTTRDAKLTDKISLTENFIKQNVTLKEFTNGKAYNLKLILGLTSVKVDAEVSNWEVGTVESNLPQNLE